MCHVFPPTVDFAGAVGALAYVYRYPPAWSLKQQILHYPGDPWTAGQKASANFPFPVGRVVPVRGLATGRTGKDQYSGITVRRCRRGLSPDCGIR